MSATSFTCFVHNFVSGNDMDAGENVLVFIPEKHITGHVQQVELMHLIGNDHFIMRSVNMLWRW